MRARIQKWSNNKALRMPKARADEVGLTDNSPVELSLRENREVIAPLTRPDYVLDELLAQVTDENLHREVDTGPAVRAQVW
jgi:antitoxin MazE